MELNEALLRLKEAEKSLLLACTIKISYDDGRIPSWYDILEWRTEMAREYCVKYGLLKDST